TLVVLALPPLLLGTRLPNRPGVIWFLFYFVCIGAGYILVEVALIQKFVLFLGHPTYALTVVIFSLLLSSGTVSFWSRKLVAECHGQRDGVGRRDYVLDLFRPDPDAADRRRSLSGGAGGVAIGTRPGRSYVTSSDLQVRRSTALHAPPCFGI